MTPRTAKEWAELAAKELAMDLAHIPMISAIIEKYVHEAMAQDANIARESELARIKSATDQSWNDAMEEAAEECDELKLRFAASLIRSLKKQPKE